LLDIDVANLSLHLSNGHPAHLDRRNHRQGQRPIVANRHRVAQRRQGVAAAFGIVDRRHVVGVTQHPFDIDGQHVSCIQEVFRGGVLTQLGQVDGHQIGTRLSQ